MLMQAGPWDYSWGRKRQAVALPEVSHLNLGFRVHAVWMEVVWPAVLTALAACARARAVQVLSSCCTQGDAMVVCYLHDVRSILQLRSLKKVRSRRLWEHAGSPRHRPC